MKNKFIRLLMIFMMLFSLINPVQAVNESLYSTLDVNANGTILVESVQVNGYGKTDTSADRVGEFKVNGTKTFTYEGLEEGDYYYRVSMVNKGAPNVTYDDTTYTVWLCVFKDNETGTLLQSIVLQNDDDTTSKPLNVKFINTVREEEVYERTITYTEYTPDGKTVSTTVTQTITLIRDVVCDEDGNYITDDKGRIVVKGDNGYPTGYNDKGEPILLDENGNPLLDENGNEISTTIWKIDRTRSSYESIVSPSKDGWEPDQVLVEEWVIDLNEPQDEIVHVVYVPETEKVETTTITRTITYTEYTPDGKEVSKTVTQVITLQRTVVVDADGKIISTGKWGIVNPEGDYGSVISPTKDGWLADKLLIGVWDIDLDNPRDEIIHVIYTPIKKAAPDTSDNSRINLYGNMLIGAIITMLLSIVFINRMKMHQE